MARKLFYNMHIRAMGGRVELTFFKSTPLFLEKKSEDSIVVRIFRKEEPTFTFNEDYEEYFDGLSMEGAELIFEGSMETLNDRKYHYIDESVKLGSTYAYWVSSDRGDAPLGPAPVRVRDRETWWPRQEIERRMGLLQSSYPKAVSLKTYGRTIRGQEIRGLQCGNTKNCVALIGLIHPGESGPELILPAIERLLKDHGDVLEKTGVAILPSVVNDQRERLVQGHPGYLRTNFNGVDINRNFPAEWEITEYNYGLITSDPDAITYRGPQPCSEPETRAVMAFIEDCQPQYVFTFHALASICGPCFLTTKYAQNDGKFAQKCLPAVRAYTDGFFAEEQRELNMRYASSSGSLSTWLYRKFGIPGFDLEWDGEAKSAIAHNDRTTRELLYEYQERHYEGILQMLQEISR